MKCLLLISLFLASFITLADSVQISGYVPARLDLRIEDSIAFKANLNLKLELKHKSGLLRTHNLQYDKEVYLNKSELKKVVVYAP